jgi:cell wall assembly regulator SMI1
MKEIWKKIEAWLERWSPNARKSLRPGASDEALAALGQRLGFELPGELREHLEVHDGQDLAADCGLLNGWIFLSCDRIERSHRIVTTLLKNGDFRKNQAMSKDGLVKPVWWSERWIPFLEGPRGDMMCVDMDPAEGGEPGQIITFWKAEGDRKVRARDLESLLEQFAADLRGGKYAVDEDGGLEKV